MTPDNPSHPPAEVIRISPAAYLRGMWSLLWTAFRHPFTTTVIDATTGRAIEP